MSSLIATVNDDGTLQTKTTSGDSLTSSKSDNSVVDSDTFLTLLVAEMQNQDPLEPTSNTEWVSQYATFTQVQQMSEMADSVDLLRANELIGKDVIMKVTSSSTGDVTYARGKVEYVEVENGESILVIDGNKYSLSDLDSVISDEYSEAYDLYTTFTANIDSLPDIKYADLSYAEKIAKLYNQYNNEMDDYQKNFMVTYASSEVDTLTNWVAALTKLGVDFDTTEEEEESTSLDDILESFNSKMSDILDRLVTMSDQIEVSNTNTSNISTSSANVAANTATTTTSTDTVVSTTSDTDNNSEEDTDVSDEAIEALTADTEEEETIDLGEEISDEETTDNVAEQAEAIAVTTTDTIDEETTQTSEDEAVEESTVDEA
jgi:flagellar basal-body rod modification protein FlgD